LHPGLRDRFLFCSSQPIPLSIPRDHAVRFLTKPFDLTDLWAKLLDLLAGVSPSVAPDRD
jgi:hypothetical protein